MFLFLLYRWAPERSTSSGANLIWERAVTYHSRLYFFLLRVLRPFEATPARQPLETTQPLSRGQHAIARASPATREVSFGFLPTCHISAFFGKIIPSRICLYLSGFRLHWAVALTFPLSLNCQPWRAPRRSPSTFDFHFLCCLAPTQQACQSLIFRTTPTGASFPSIVVHFHQATYLPRLSVPVARLICCLGCLADLNSSSQSVAHRFHFLLPSGLFHTSQLSPTHVPPPCL